MNASSPFVLERPDWSLPRRVGFRFLFVYALLFFFPLPLDTIPGSESLFGAYTKGWYALADWLDTYIFHIGFPNTETTGSGDRSIDYFLAAISVALSALVAVIWSLVDRRSRGHERLAEGLWIYVRIGLAYTMLSYGFAKVFEGQFPAPPPARLAQPIGDSSPMGILWTFMGSSKAYTMFGGLMEVVGGLLLLSRRTTTLGALVVCTVMANVVALNLCYDVPVKLYSSQLLLTAALLTIPDLRRLASVLVLNRATTPRPPRRSLPRRWMEPLRLPALLALTGWLTYHCVDDELERMAFRRPPEVARYRDHFVVEAFTVHGAAAPVADAIRWRTVNTGHRQSLFITTMDGKATPTNYEVDKATQALTLTTDDGITYVLAAEWTTPTTVILRGLYRGASVVVQLRAVGTDHYLLRSRGFHWVNERGLNR